VSRAGAGRALRVALIGYGGAGAVLHAPLITATPGLELGAIVTTRPAPRRAASTRYPGTRVLADVGDVWRGEFDLVVVATSSASHAGLAERAIAAGLATIVDKPFATSSASAERIVAQARARGVPLTVFQNRRWDSAFLTLRRVLAEGRLGRPLRLEARFERFQPVDPTAWQERPADGGGALLDLGSHLIDQAVVLFGRPTAVSAELHRRRPGSLVEDDGLLSLTCAGGVTCHLWLSWTAHATGPALRMLGSDAAFEIDALDPQWAALARGDRPGGHGWGRPTSTGRLWSETDPGPGPRRIRAIAGDYPAFYASVRDALVDAGTMPVDPSDAVEVLRIIEAARVSAERGQVVRVDGGAAR
jgi:predicted dehydrogenase